MNEDPRLLHNSIKCPDGTILVSRYQHHYVEHQQEDGRTYFVDGGLEYSRVGHSDDNYEDLSVYNTSSHTLIRERFEWGNCLDKDGKPLPKTVYLKLKDITQDHLMALVEYTKDYSNIHIHEAFVNEVEYRYLHDIKG